MRTLRSVLAIFILGSCAWAAIPALGHAQSAERPVVGISSDEAPPPLPEYDQPPIPGPNFVWTPGYWQWNNIEYYWVPGTWMVPPAPGLLWTPGYWEFRDGVYVFNHGYWGRHVGFYGGIAYGFGYNGTGFEGGKVKKRANNSASFNGGPQGIVAEPTPEDEAAATEPHFGPTRLQMELMREASKMDALFESTNHGKPEIAATSRPGDFGGPGVVAARSAGTMPAPVSGTVSPKVNEIPTTSGTGVFGGLGPVPAGSSTTTKPATGVSPKVKETKPSSAKQPFAKPKEKAPVEKKKLEAKPPVEKPVVQKKKPPIEKPAMKPAVVEKPKPAHEEKPHLGPKPESQTKPPLTTPVTGVSPKVKETKPSSAKQPFAKPKEKTAAEKKKLEVKPHVEKPAIKPVVVGKPKPAHEEKLHGPKPANESQTHPSLGTPVNGTVSPKVKEAKPSSAKQLSKPKEKTVAPVEKKKLEAKPHVEKPAIKPVVVGKPKPAHEEKLHGPKPQSQIKPPLTTPVTGVSPKAKETKPNLETPSSKPKEKPAIEKKKKLEVKPHVEKPAIKPVVVGKPKPAHEEKPHGPKPQSQIKPPLTAPVNGTVSPKVKEAKPSSAKQLSKPKEKTVAPVEKKKLEAKPYVEKPAIKPVVVKKPKPVHEEKPHGPKPQSQIKPPLTAPVNGTVSPKVKEAKPSLSKQTSAKPKEKTPTTNTKKKKSEKKTPAEKPVDLHDD
jgi:hypothetical protein